MQDSEGDAAQDTGAEPSHAADDHGHHRVDEHVHAHVRVEADVVNGQAACQGDKGSAHQKDESAGVRRVVAHRFVEDAVGAQRSEPDAPGGHPDEDEERRDHQAADHQLPHLRGGDDDAAEGERAVDGIVDHLGLVAEKHGQQVDNHGHHADGGDHGHVVGCLAVLQGAIDGDVGQQAQSHREGDGDDCGHQHGHPEGDGEKVEHISGKHVDGCCHDVEQPGGVIHQREPYCQQGVEDAGDDAVYEELG